MTDHNPWRFLSAKTAFDNPWLRLVEQEVIDPAGQQRIYGIVRFKKLAVGVLPVTDEGQVHLVGQWRVPLSRYSWEMPEGGCEAGEDPLDCARRELEEEAGVRALRLEPIVKMDLSNSVTDEQAICYLATGLFPGVHAPEPVEVLRNRLVPFREVLADVAAGRIMDAMTVAAVLRAHHMAVTGEIDAGLAAAMLGK
ncbi:MAG: NUDIX hydrolase [Hyphomonadaceae bacterium]|nr:MAG: MutT/nudix family phosphohydrolase [Caulobacteraceae bacterium]MBT9445498.1 NUDIX hydrolase [Hyphomonadaceae bacterium]TPW07026.1 MAG: MutT/nudix family phosphohydrolase [Alphaproteobacteria bacterium]